MSDNLTESTLQIYQTGKNNDFSYIKEYFLKGNLFLGTTKIEEADFIKLRKYIKILEEMFPGNWNIEMKKSANLESLHISGFTIRLPKATIRNSQNESLDIKNIFIHLPMRLLGNQFEAHDVVRGLRTSVTESEDYESYFHSHISGTQLTDLRDLTEDHIRRYGNILNFKQFCEGSGDIIVAKRNFSRSNSDDSFIGLLVQVVRIATWESLEGGPYKNINEVIHSSARRSRSSNNQSSSDRVYYYLQFNYSDADLEKMVMILLQNCYLLDPQFYVKFEETIFSNGLTGLDVQNRNQIFSKIVTSFKDLASKCASPSDVIVLGSSPDSNRRGMQLNQISCLFSYKKEQSGVVKEVGIVPRLLFVAEQPESNTQGTSYIKKGPNVILYFRGQPFEGREYQNENSDIERETKLNLEAVSGLRILSKYEDKIIEIIKKKIKDNVENVRNERTSASLPF